ncbi:AN1-type zinc finger protein [Halobacterium noricense]|uniref:AN1-type zinc finger protein n=1 Tax=Halobacterium noricense TaxID=223182 RepID=UPI001E509B2A|nr:AN1-type zinc finger protein [Halobacterium noricense]UHH27300.1 AN1-type zinc finger domain-containing protein [Halobacterium noricense]
MATCEVCGTEISGTTLLECDDCGKNYCRKHYHDHDCDPVEEPLDEQEEHQLTQDTGEQENQATGSQHVLQQLGYLIAVVAAGIGLIYLAISFDAILVGGGIQDAVHLSVAGVFFSLATFLLVASYILAKS